MPECQREDLRELLPLLAQDALPAGDLAALRQHLEGCAACRAELEVLGTVRRVLLARTPRLELDRITAAVAAPSLTVVRGGAGHTRAPRVRWMARRYLAAAASLLVVGSLSLAVVQGVLDGGDAIPRDSLASVPGGESATGLSFAGGLGDLSDADLAALLEALDAVEGTVEAEPASLRTAIVDPPEGT